MIGIWTDLLNLFITFITYFTDALYNVLNTLIDFDIKTFEINLTLFSENPIISISLYHLLNLLIFYFIFKWFFKIVMSIIFAPLNAVKKYLNLKGVVKK